MTRMTGEISERMRQCIDTCDECHRVCEQTIDHALRQGGAMVERGVMSTLMDCADICRLSADMMMRQSPMANTVCMICAEVCRACADACSRFDDDATRACAEACHRCAESCTEMAGMRM
ncbi:four-helix bundle copper-binding protein [Streptoalloteichus hindustanus]|uniref:Ferredoxin n=1 Tax=Streptoalloteichus hindustanus TaxID=2017 RepID=A0A1M5H700_STRHI|nr:four-helix bundle copper-binding protein [Streptoalloteichus hindustanus]SHG11767.1 hypothetical protein SAMN05444320_106429 [Streptoalloteichus hindustanus]